MNDCEHTPRVHALHDGELSPAEADELRSHIGGCAQCAAEYAACEVVSAHVRAAPRPVAPPGLALAVRERIDQYADGRVLRLAWWLTSAAAVILVACLLRLELGGGATVATPAPEWELSATYASFDSTAPSGNDERQFAQWIVDDLSHRSQ